MMVVCLIQVHLIQIVSVIFYLFFSYVRGAARYRRVISEMKTEFLIPKVAISLTPCNSKPESLKFQIHGTKLKLYQKVSKSIALLRNFSVSYSPTNHTLGLIHTFAVHTSNAVQDFSSAIC